MAGQPASSAGTFAVLWVIRQIGCEAQHDSMASSQGSAQVTSHYVLTGSMPVKPGAHQTPVGAGSASSMADGVCIAMLKTLLRCIAKWKLCYDIVRSQSEKMCIWLSHAVLFANIAACFVLCLFHTTNA